MSSKWLNTQRRNVTSQNGEDGVIGAIFERIGRPEQGWCCEFGAWDGIHYSNTRALIEQGWAGVLIESDAERYAELVQNNIAFNNVSCLWETVNNLDETLGRTAIPRDFDVLSIDVDNDYGHESTSGFSMWQRLTRYRPRVVILEVNSCHPPDDTAILSEGCTIRQAVELAKSKGYELALHTGNCIFVRCSEAFMLDVDPDNWQELFDGSWL